MSLFITNKIPKVDGHLIDPLHKNIFKREAPPGVRRLLRKVFEWFSPPLLPPPQRLPDSTLVGDEITRSE